MALWSTSEFNHSELTMIHLLTFLYRNIDGEIDGIYESGTEIFFNCIPNAAGDRMTWRIICDNGQWIGRSYNCGKNYRMWYVQTIGTLQHSLRLDY